MNEIHMTVAIAEWMDQVVVTAVLHRLSGGMDDAIHPRHIRLAVPRNRHEQDPVRAAQYLQLLCVALTSEESLESASRDFPTGG